MFQISEAFAEMIFRHGFVHCDPHAANMLVRVAPFEKNGLFGKSPSHRILRPHLLSFLNVHKLVASCVTRNYKHSSVQVLKLVLLGLVFPGRRKQPQLVLLDHGLYKELDPKLRLHYAALWKVIGSLGSHVACFSSDLVSEHLKWSASVHVF